MSLEPAAPIQAPDTIAARALAGDREAERELCRRLLPAVQAFAARRLPASAAEDFAHDALLLLVQALRQGRVLEPARLSSYALGICRNLARERARAGERRRELVERYGLSEPELRSWEGPLLLRRDRLEDCYSQLTDQPLSWGLP